MIGSVIVRVDIRNNGNKGLVMNKKPARTGPKLRITRTAFRLKKLDDPPLFQPKSADEHKYIYTCQYCRLKFTQNSQFFRHMTSNHANLQKQASFECNDCQIVFSKKANLDLHCQTHHQVKSKSRCEACAITFKSRHCLRRHLKLKQIMSENSCLNCQKKFTNKELLAKHVKNKHTFKNVTHQCDVCSVKFKEKASLQNHLDRIHKKL